MTIECRPITGHFGAEVSGVDLAGLDDSGAKELLDVLHEHLVLVFHDQALDDDTQLATARLLGEPYVHPIAREFGATEAIVEHIIDDAEHRPFQDQWHTDISWIDEPPTYGFLRAVELPDRGGDTCWLDARAAYDALADTTKGQIEDLHALHTVGMGKAFVEKTSEELVRTLREKFPGVEHPVVTTHAPTGRRSLFVNEGFTSRIVDADDEAVLADLLTHLRNPNFQLRHRWTDGDVVLWDERATQHFAVADFWPARREMARITIATGGRLGKEPA